MKSHVIELGGFALVAVTMTASTIVFLRRHARRFGLVDLPDARKQHGEAVPLIGGIGIAFSVCVTGLLLDVDSRAFAVFLVAALPLIVTGLLDDRLDLEPSQRFMVQAVSALILVLGGKVALTGLGDLFGFGVIQLGWMSVPFTLFCAVGLINAFNMADGVDGLAGGLTMASAAMLAVAAAYLDAARELSIAIVLFFAVAGFMIFNLRHRWRPFRVFMGDAGSMFLGFALAWLALGLSQRAGGALYPICIVWILGLPVMDTVATMFRRARLGRSPFAPDRTHLHHLLLALGLSPTRVVLVEVAAATAMAGIGIAAWRLRVPEVLLTCSFLAIAATYWLAYAFGWQLVERGTHTGLGALIDIQRRSANESDTARTQREFQRRR
jgi:UDP-GlcNAc:undecaprenyl-phosphate GlcNAc-1-phosphate transferase